MSYEDSRLAFWDRYVHKVRVAILGNGNSFGLHYFRALRANGGDADLYYSRYGCPPGEPGDPLIEHLTAAEASRIHMWNSLPYEWEATSSVPLRVVRQVGTSMARVGLWSMLRRAAVLHALGGETAFAQRVGRPYFAHATGADLRELILNHVRGTEPSRAGAALLDAYRQAEAVLVCIPEMMPVADEVLLPRAVYAPMPMDLSRYPLSTHRENPQSLHIFAPARLEWNYAGNLRRGSSLKANDRLVKAFAQFRESLPGARLTLRSIGSDVAVTRQLVADLGLSEAVEFLGPLDRDALVERYRQADIVVDQFIGGCLGWVGLEAMACGRPLITFIDEELYKRIEQAPPPIANAQTVEQIEAALEELVTARRRADLGIRARTWIETYHDAREIGREMMRISRQAIDPYRKFAG